jgi:hypothetical protein
MTERSVTLAAVKEKKHECACGCTPCEEENCHLICPTRPRFFCGQLLTDQDLATLVTWTQDRLRLQRFHLGWGVVCGLEVTRSDKPDHLAVSPGYAVSCCGDDLVLCQPYTVDLSQICLPKSRPCEEPARDEPEYYLFDLMLQAHEEPTAFQTALGCNGRHTQADCEHSRVVENTAVIPVPVADEIEGDPTKSWSDEYIDWWQRWREANSPEYGDQEAWWYHLLEAFWHSPNRAGCHICHKERGVPLARIWVSRVEKACEIVAIDVFPPVRRLLERDSWPAPQGWINYAQFLGRPWPKAAADVVTYLQHHAIPLAGVKIIEEPEAALKFLEQKPIAAYNQPLTAVLVNMGKLGQRLIGFCPPQVAAKKAPTAMREPERHDLTRVHGIGPASAKALNEAGIYTYQQLMAMSHKELQRIVKGLMDESIYKRLVAEARQLAKEEASRD